MPLFVPLAPWLGEATGGGAALSYVYANSGCVAATLAVCLVSLFVCVSLVRVVIICPACASTHTALVSSPSLTVLHLSTYLYGRLFMPSPQDMASLLLLRSYLRLSRAVRIILILPSAGDLSWSLLTGRLSP